MIRQLHEGRTVDEVKAEFAALLQDVGAAEIAELEQALIDEGLPEMEVKRLCDVHVAAFRESLDAQARPEMTPGHPVHTFRAENAAAGLLLDQFAQTLAELKAEPTVDRLEEPASHCAGCASTTSITCARSTSSSPTWSGTASRGHHR
jgi:DUF438 domain-containing protein